MTIKISEPTFGFDDFKQSKKFDGLQGLAKQILNLIVMEPKTIPSNPDMGLGIALYKYEFDTDATRSLIRERISEQIDTYLPEYRSFIQSVVVEPIPKERLSLNNKGVYIGIYVSQKNPETGDNLALIFPNIYNNSNNNVISEFVIL